MQFLRVPGRFLLVVLALVPSVLAQDDEPESFQPALAASVRATVTRFPLPAVQNGDYHLVLGGISGSTGPFKLEVSVR